MHTETENGTGFPNPDGLPQAGGVFHEGKIYREEPILRTAARQAADEAPPEYEEMQRIAEQGYREKRPVSWVFYRQAKLMENFEDHYVCRDAFCIPFSTYQSMSLDDLRGYFSWRTQVRHGEIHATEIGYAVLYISEILNQIGVTSPREGFEMLRHFWEVYRKQDARVDFYIRNWITEYIIYYNLDRSLLTDFYDFTFDNAASVLLHYGSHSREELFFALRTLSSYNVALSGFYKQYQQDFETVACGVFARVSEFYEKKYRYTACEKFFGPIAEFPCNFFLMAVFYEGETQTADCEYTVSDVCQYRRRNRKWYCRRFFGIRGKSQLLGKMLRAIDCRMRNAYGFRTALKPEKTTKTLSRFIEKELEALQNEKLRQEKEREKKEKEAAAPKIEIDLSKLQGIRESAVTTCEKLLSETEPAEVAAAGKPAAGEPEPAKTAAAGPAPASEKVSSEPEASPPAAGGLNGTEIRFLRCLLCGEPYDSFLREKGIPVSVVAEAVNEKLWEDFGDTVIVFEGDLPTVLEDYADELKGYVSL